MKINYFYKNSFRFDNQILKSNGYLEGTESATIKYNSKAPRGRGTPSIKNEPRYEKPGFCICENKDADQLRSNCAADQRLCFRYIDTTIPLLSKSEISSF